MEITFFTKCLFEFIGTLVLVLLGALAAGLIYGCVYFCG